VFVRELSTLGIAYHSPALDPFCGRLRGRARPASPWARAWPIALRRPRVCFCTVKRRLLVSVAH